MTGEPIAVDEALARIRAVVERGPTHGVPLAGAHGRVLAEPVQAAWDVPACTNSALDGWAFAHDDHAEPLVVAGTVHAGDSPPPLVRGTAMRITTGARLPAGADTVVANERAHAQGERLVISTPPAPGANVRRRGEDMRAGERVLAAGTRIGPDVLAVLATFGVDPVPVVLAPKVAVLRSGDELVAPADASPDASADANGPAMLARLSSMGCETLDLGIVRDDARAMRDALAHALEHADLVLTIGGLSAGERDFVRPALSALGVHLDVCGVAVRPGKPISFGHRDDKLVLALPGNPRAAVVGFHVFGRALVWAWLGETAPAPVRAALTREVRKPAGVRHIVPGRVHSDDDARLWVDPTARTGSALLSSPLGQNALVHLPEGRERLRAGDVVDVELTA